MQVGLHRQDRIEVAAEERTYRTLGDRFAVREDGVLSHVGEVGCHERHALCPRLAEGIGGENRLNQLGVRVDREISPPQRPDPRAAGSAPDSPRPGIGGARSASVGQLRRSGEPLPECHAVWKNVDASLVHRMNSERSDRSHERALRAQRCR